MSHVSARLAVKGALGDAALRTKASLSPAAAVRVPVPVSGVSVSVAAPICEASSASTGALAADCVTPAAVSFHRTPR
ncbi:hypothetical protein D3C83_97800 [compost metagenome]